MIDALNTCNGDDFSLYTADQKCEDECNTVTPPNNLIECDGGCEEVNC